MRNLLRAAAITALLVGISQADAQTICCSGGGGGGAVTFPLNGANGTSAAPSYSFTNGTDSGMYANANGSVTIVGAKGAVGGAVALTGGTPTSGNVVGGTANITAGNSIGTAAGGAVSITGGNAGTTATGASSGGGVTITSGVGNTSNTGSGDITISVPATPGVAGGVLTMIGGIPTSSTTDAVSIQSRGSGQITIQPGASGNGGTIAGGTLQLLGGLPSAGGSTGGGGPILIKAGAGTGGGNGPAGTVTISGGVATEGNGGTVTITGTSAATLGALAHNGGNVNITAGAASGTGTVGEVQINGNGAISPVSFQYNLTNPSGVSFFTATRAVLVKAIICRPDVLQGAVATLSVLKAPSATAISAGTVLHSGSFDANAGAATNQTLTLSATLADINLASGDSIGVTTTGTWTAGKGSCTVHLQPK